MTGRDAQDVHAPTCRAAHYPGTPCAQFVHASPDRPDAQAMHAADAPPVHAEQATRADARDAVAAWDAMRARQRAHSARARQDGPTTPGTARQDATGPLSGQDGPAASPFPPDASELHPAG